MSDRDSDDNVRSIRKALLLESFDPSDHIGEKVGCISIDLYEIEKEFLNLFEKLTEDAINVSKVIENDTVKLQNASSKMEIQLMNEVDAHSIRLSTIVGSVDSVKSEFDKSVEGTIRIGGRLTVAEGEKLRIEKAMQLLDYTLFFQKAPSSTYADIKDVPAEQIKKLLPPGLCNQPWGTISRTLHDLKSILTDTEMNSEEVSQATQIVFAICQSIEYELLGQFDVALNRLMYNMNDKSLAKNARELAHWLHLYSGGRSIQQKYIFTVVQRRIPSDAFFTGGKNPSNNFANPWDKIVDVLNIRSNNNRHPNNTTNPNDDDSSAGASLEDSEQGDDIGDENFRDDGDRDQQRKRNNDSLLVQPQIASPSGNTNSSLLLIDHLSGLFAMINNVCAEQFEIIRMVFPRNAVARVTRLLIQRIFNDPAFGIQAKIESILVPQPPRPQLPLADYLDALVTVREKLTALNLMLIEYCSHPSMKGGVEVGQRLVGNTRKEKNRNDPGQEKSGDGGVDAGEDSDLLDEEEIEDNIRSDNEIRDFFDEQISHVLSDYAADYYDKELTHIQNQYVSYLRKAVDDLTSLNKVYAGTVLQPLPHLKAEKMKSIPNLVNSVLNQKFVNGIVSITTDALLRMESIGRDDSKLPGKIKDLFIFQLDFFIQGVFIPSMQASTTFLLKIASAKPQNSSLPPMEYFAAVAALSFAVSKIKSHFEDLFVRSLNSLPNAVAVCKENRKRAFKSLENYVRVSMYAWSLCIIVHIEKILFTLQSKYDFAPASATLTGRNTSTKRLASSSCTVACDAVCKELLTVANTVHTYENAIQGLDLVKLFWRPFGQQFLGVVISHIRRQKVSEDGAEVLINDINEYIQLFAIMEVPETIDMLYCLKEVCSIYSAKPERVAKIIIEDLRHLDTAIVMALSHARGDSTARGTATHWTKVVSAQFPSFKADPTFPWEIKKHLTVVSFQQSFDSQRDNKIGPKTLRKSTAPLSARQLSEIARTHTLSNRNKVGLSNFGRGDGQTISLDMTQLQNFDENAPLDIAKLVSNIPSNQHSGRPAAPTSTYLPSRPDDMNSFISRPNGSSGGEVLKTISVNGVEISRPDLIGGTNASKSAAKSSDKKSVSSAPSFGGSSISNNSDRDKDREDLGRRSAEDREDRTASPAHGSRNPTTVATDKGQKSTVSTFKMVTSLFSKRS